MEGDPSIEALDVEGCTSINDDEIMALEELAAVEESLKAFVLPDGHMVESEHIIQLKKQLAMGVPPAYQNIKLLQSGAETLMEKIWAWSEN